MQSESLHMDTQYFFTIRLLPFPVFLKSKFCKFAGNFLEILSENLDVPISQTLSIALNQPLDYSMPGIISVWEIT